MTVLEIVLLIAGVLCVAVSFLVKDGSGQSLNTGDEQPKELTEQDKERIKRQIDEILEKKISDISEKTEAQLDKISNTKILEMNDYAETVMEEINRNHNETVFLYDMLNEKAKEVKSTVRDVNMAKREVARMQYESTITMEEPRELKGSGSGKEGAASKTDNAKRVSAYSKSNPTGAQANGIIAAGANLQQTSKSEVSEKESTGTGYSYNNYSKDLAKERLMELVRKSTENSKELQRTEQFESEPLKAELLKDAGADSGKTESLKDERAGAEKAEAANSESAKKKVQSKGTVKLAKETASEPKVTVKEENKSEPEETAVKPKTTRKRTVKKAPAAENIEQKQPEDINVNIQFDKNINKNEAIIDMYKSGISNKDIAKQLNLGIGEVKLVVDLFKNTK